MARFLFAVVLAAAAAGCGARTAQPAVDPLPGGGAGMASGPAAPVVTTALSLRGVPYRPGGTTPAGFDCSGFVQYVFGLHGWRVPREVAALFRVGGRIRREDIETGDLLFFRTAGRGASHVAIALDGRTFVHAPSSRGRVRVERLDTQYWSTRYLGARRILAE